VINFSLDYSRNTGRFYRNEINTYRYIQRRRTGEMALFSLMSNDIGIDLGTATILVYIKGKGVVLREPR